jgi:Xaa-Pro aminopeptidase
VGLGSVVWKSAGIFDVDETSTAIVGNLDAKSIRQKAIYDQTLAYGKEGPLEALHELVRKRRAKKIAVNTSRDFGIADGLSFEMRQYLRKAIDDSAKLVSAEDLVIALRTQLISEELMLIKRSIEKCEQIFRIAEKDIIRVGKTDREIHQMLQAETRKLGLDLAWSADHCPTVNIGNGEFAHNGYSNVMLKQGQLIHLDFGVKYKGYCSDLQRVYWVGGSSSSPPTSIKKIFESARNATQAGIETLKPGIRGYIIDEICRRSVVSSGFPEYLHGTGHPIARETHEIGPMLCPRWRERYGHSMEKRLQAGMVFSIEPSAIGKECTINVEQNVLLTERGAEVLSIPQEYLYEI